MEYNNFHNNYSGTNEQRPFVCPMVQDFYSCCQPMYRIIGDTEQPEFNYEAEEAPLEHTVNLEEDRAPRDVDRVVRMIERDARNEIRELERIGINPRLVNYFVTSMVSLIDRNFNRYRGTLEQRVQEAEQDIRRDLHWIFDIFRTLAVSPATSGRLTDTVVRASIRNLRPAAAIPPAPPSVPSPTVPHTPPTSMPR